MNNRKGSILEQHSVPHGIEKQRLQEYAVGIFQSIISRKGTKKAIKSGRITVDGKKGDTGDWIVGGEEIDLLSATSPHQPFTGLSLEVLYEDSHLAVVNKPPGILVSGNKHRTIERALPVHLKSSTESSALPHPMPVHRLDYPTSGLLLVAKTSTALAGLKELFEARKIQKTYIAVTVGDMEASGNIDVDVDGKEAHSRFKKLESVASERYQALNLVELHPETGRRHQLRKHLLAIGNPILGDPLYKLETDTSKGGRLYLHASGLVFQHPVSGVTLELSASFPKKFLKLFPSLDPCVSD